MMELPDVTLAEFASCQLDSDPHLESAFDGASGGGATSAPANLQDNAAISV